MVVLISVVIVYLYLGHITVSFLERLAEVELDGSDDAIRIRTVLMAFFPLVILFGLFYYTRKFILNVGRKNDV